MNTMIIERSIEEDPKKILKNSSWNGGPATIFYKVAYRRFVIFRVFHCLKTQYGLILHKSLKLREYG